MKCLRPSRVGLAFACLIAFCLSLARAEEKPENLPPASGSLAHELSSGLPPPIDRSADPRSAASPALSQPIEIPFIFEGGHIIVEASIDGAPPRPFLFDTGGRNLIAREAASGLQLPVEKTVRVGGIGANRPSVDMVTVKRITIGAATLAQQHVGIIDIPNVVLDRGSRPRLAGLIGSELLLHYAITIDYGRRTLTLNASGSHPKSAAFALPLGMAISPDGLSHPQVKAELDGVSADYLIDTGANAQVALFEKYQQDHAPFKDAATTLHFMSPGGIGGRAGAVLGFLHQLQLGSHTNASPLVSGVDRGGSRIGGLSYAAGVIGNATLADFVVTLDLAATRAYFDPLPDRVHATSLFGTGMVLDKPDHDGFEVIDIIKGTAAERLGLHVGDRVIAIAGHPARDFGLADVHMFSSKGLPALAVEMADRRRMELSYSRLLP